MNLLPTTEGQPLVMTIAGDEFEVERGHWYSPEAVQNAIYEALEEAAITAGSTGLRVYNRCGFADPREVGDVIAEAIRSRIGPQEEK